jgi:hypothetical protein
MAMTGNVGDSFDEISAYQQTFGNMRNKTVYQKINVKSLLKSGKPEFENDVRPKINEMYNSVSIKAHTTQAGGAGTAGYAMIPVYVDPKIVDLTRKYTPLVEVIPRVTNLGLFADYNQITAKGGGFTAVEDASMQETNTTYDRVSKAIKFLYAVGRVTGPSQAGQPSYIMMGMNPVGGATGAFSDASAPNAMQGEALVKARELRELEENLIINGNATTSGIAGNPNGTEFDGIITLLGSTNTVDKNTTALDLDDFNLAAQYAFDDGGRPNFAVGSSNAFTDTLNLITQKIGYMQAASEVEWGFTAIKLNTIVGQIPLIPSMFMSNVSGSKAVYMLDLNVVEMRVLQDMTYEELGKTNDSRKFMMKIYECLIIRAPSYCASITEISA